MTRPEREREWFDDEDFWRETYPFMFPERRFAETPEQVEAALALAVAAGAPEVGDALDLCCGPGRCSVELARRGWRVTGVDLTAFLLRKARARARREGVRVAWRCADMRDFVRSDAFDLALSMFTSFGYFDDKGEDLLVLANLHASLRPGGVLVIDTMGKEKLARILQPTTGEELPDGTKLVQRHEIIDDWTRIRNEWIVIRKGRARSFVFHHTIYSGLELRERLEGAGFIAVELFGSLAGDPYDHRAERLIAVARKAGRGRR